MQELYSRVFSEYGLAVLALVAGNVIQALAIRTLYKRNVTMVDRAHESQARSARVGENLSAALAGRRTRSEPPNS
jgi:hypothetical protein